MAQRLGLGLEQANPAVDDSVKQTNQDDDDEDDDENDFSGPALGGHVKTQSDFSEDDEEDKPMTMRMMMMRPTTTTTTTTKGATATGKTKTNATTPLKQVGGNHLNVPISRKKKNYNEKDAYDV